MSKKKRNSIGSTHQILLKISGKLTPELQAHREHLLARQRFQVNLHQGLFCKLNTVMEMVLAVARNRNLRSRNRL